MNLEQVTDALAAAQKRGLLPTSLSTKELRDLGAELLARSVFSARATNAIYVSELKKLIDKLAAGDLGEGQVRTALWELGKMLGYDSEKGGFPGEELEPALKGTLQDLMSFRRRDLIVRTQRDLMQGAGAKMRGSEPDRLSEFPAWELVRNLDVKDTRDWPGRWAIAGGKPRVAGRDAMAYKVVGEPTGFIALKGDPVWGELGSSDNFSDALGVDHPPFYFNSGMGWREVSTEEAAQLGVTGPDGETPEEWLQSEPATLSGKQPLPTPQVSLNGVDPAIIERFKELSKAQEVPGKPGKYTLLERSRMDLEDEIARDRAARDATRAAQAAGTWKGDAA
jgi:hypothetical protein